MALRENRSRTVGMKTAAVHAGHPPNPVTGASAPDVVMSTTFIIDPGISFSADQITDETPFVYTRWGNPTVAQLEDKLAVLEGAEDCVAFASGWPPSPLYSSTASERATTWS